MSTAATSLTFREYTDGDGNHLIIDTDYIAYTDEQVRKKTVHLAWADARELGTSLIAWTGTAQTWANNRFGRDNQIVDVAVEDGKATITIGGIHLTLSEDDVIDLGQRLIAWAGVLVKGVGWNAISVRRARKMIEGEILQPVLAEWEKTSLAKELEGLRDAVDARRRAPG